MDIPHHILASLTYKLDTLFSNSSLNFVSSVLIFFIGWLIAKWVYRSTKKHLLKNSKIDGTIALLCANGLRYLFFIFIGMHILQYLGFSISSILTAFGAAGLAIGLALQKTLTNIAAGLMIITLRPFKRGDLVKIPNMDFASIVEIKLFVTETRTTDGRCVFVPNAQLWNKQITNFSHSANSRIELFVSINYEDTVQNTCKNIREALSKENTILKNPRPVVELWQFLGNAMELIIHVWVKTPDYTPTRLKLADIVKEALEKSGSSLSSQRVAHLSTDSDILLTHKKYKDLS